MSTPDNVRLADSEGRYLSLLTSTHDMVQSVGPDGQLLYANPRWLEVLEYEPEEIAAINLFDVVAPASRSHCQLLFRCVMAGEKVTDVCAQFRTKSGRIIDVEGSASPWVVDGEVVATHGFFRDISERLRTEQALAESEERFRSAFEDAATGMALQDPDGGYIRTNAAFCEITGYSEAELQKMSYRDITHPDDLLIDSELDKEMLSGQRRFHRGQEKRYLHKSGRLTWTLTSASIVRDKDGNPIARVVNIQDITARKEAELKLLEAERRYADLYERGPDMYVSIDPATTKIVRCNQTLVDKSGYSKEELIDQPVLMLYDESSHAVVKQTAQEFLDDGSVSNVELKLRTKNGDFLDVSLNATAIRDEEGRIVLSRSALRDITDTKRLRREVLNTATNEQRRIGQDLHDGVGQELAGIGLLAESLVESLERADGTTEKLSSAELEQLTSLARKLSGGIGRAQQSIRTLSKGLVPVDLDFEGLTVALRDLARTLDQVEGLSCSFSCNEPVVLNDNNVATQLFRIAQEATSNALRHSRASEIRLQLGCRDGTIELSVADDGSGFGEGTEASGGVGFRTMQYRASHIGGQLTIDSNPEQGTIVTCSLPRSS